MHCMYSGIYWDEAMSNSERVTLAIVRLCLSEGISQVCS